MDETHEERRERWLREEAVKGYEDYKADPSSGLTVAQSRAALAAYIARPKAQ